MKIAIISDTWLPQVNGVVRTLFHTVEELQSQGHEVQVIGPHLFRSLPCPSYPEVRLSLWPRRALKRLLESGSFDAVHISTEGPLGIATRRWCLSQQIPFTSAYHTRFPEYLRRRGAIPLRASYAWLRRFHNASQYTLVRSASQCLDLKQRGFQHLGLWPGAVDTQLFRPYGKDYLNFPRPISMYLGRVAAEKNLKAYLDLDLPGSQVIIGDGPARKSLQRKYPKAHFLGYRHGKVLAQTLSAADVLVFPSRVETLGLVMLEAMACGVPVAAYPVPGPLDVIVEGATGSMHEDLKTAIFQALAVDPEGCIDYASDFNWRYCTECFIRFLRAPYPKTLPLAVTAQ